MTSIITALIATAVLGAPVFTQDTPRAADAPEALQLPRMAQPLQAPEAAQPARALQPAEAPEAAPVLARSPQPARAPQPPQPERQPAEERERSPAPPPPPSERRPLPTRNVKVDVTITEQSGTAAPVKKLVSLVVADGRSSNVRTNTTAPIANGNIRELPLNVDAQVNLTPDQRVLLELRFVYASASVIVPLAGEGRPAPTTAKEKAAAAPRPGYSSIQDSLVLLLTPGIPIVAARSADAATDRIVTVEVKGEILK